MTETRPPMDHEEVQDRIKRVKTLPTIPGVVEKLLALVESDDVTVAQIGETISSDQVLTAKILKIVNSPFYGFPGRICTIDHALVLLGFNVVKGTVLSAGVVDMMTDSLSGLWEHSVGVATAAGRIARYIEVDDPEEVSTAGLLHDLGKVVLSVEMHEECEEIIEEAKCFNTSFIEAEARVLDGVTHCRIAGWLAEEWNLPACLREPMALHHRPSLARDAVVPTAIVHLADVITRGLQFGWGGDPFIPQIRTEAMDVLELHMSDLATLLDEIGDELEGIDTSDFV